MQVEELRCDINGANAITFEKKLLAGERREQQRAAKCWSTGGGFHHCIPLCRAPTTGCWLLLCQPLEPAQRGFETVRGEEWGCSLPELLALASALGSDGLRSCLGLLTLSSSSLTCLPVMIYFALIYLPGAAHTQLLSLTSLPAIICFTLSLPAWGCSHSALLPSPVSLQ